MMFLTQKVCSIATGHTDINIDKKWKSKIRGSQSKKVKCSSVLLNTKLSPSHACVSHSVWHNVYFDQLLSHNVCTNLRNLHLTVKKLLLSCNAMLDLKKNVKVTWKMKHTFIRTHYPESYNVILHSYLSLLPYFSFISFISLLLIKNFLSSLLALKSI